MAKEHDSKTTSTNSVDSLSITTEDAEELGILTAQLDSGLEDLPQEVEVRTERAEGRQREISAKIQIPHSVDKVWQVLTDYEALTSFIPNLAKSRRLQHPHGGVRIEQVGVQGFLNFKFCARAVLDMEEVFPHEIRFRMVEGDFKAFSGCWQLEPLTLSGNSATQLHYKVLVLPRLTMPLSIIERCLHRELALNLSAIRQHVDELFGCQ